MSHKDRRQVVLQIGDLFKQHQENTPSCVYRVNTVDYLGIFPYCHFYMGDCPTPEPASLPLHGLCLDDSLGSLRALDRSIRRGEPPQQPV